MNHLRISLPEARAVLLHRGEMITRCLDLAVRDWREGMSDYHISAEPSTRAGLICDQFYQHARQQFANDRGFAYGKYRGQRYLTFEERLLIRVKHFDHALKSRNYATEQAVEWERQAYLPGFPPCERLNLGYRLDLTATQTTDAFVTLPNGRRHVVNDWVWQIWGDPLDLQTYGWQMSLDQIGNTERINYAYDDLEPHSGSG